MNWHQKFAVLLFAGLAALSGHAQTAGKYLAPRDQLIAIRAGRLFDAGSGMMLTNQVVIVRSDHIAKSLRPKCRVYSTGTMLWRAIR